MAIALIPARGGSKGIPRKNLQPIANVPLVARMIDIAIKADIKQVWVSTDDKEIKQVSLNHGALVIDRPAMISGDQASTESCVDHFLEQVKLPKDDVICLLQATSPFLSPKTIMASLKFIEENLEFNSCFAARTGHSFMWHREGDYWVPNNHSRSYRPRRQELPQSAIETGACYVFRAKAYLEQKTRFPEPSQIMPTSYLESLDIDTLEDLLEAQSIAGCV